MYETHLKKLNPDQLEIEYKISNLFKYIDSLPDLGLFMCVRSSVIVCVRTSLRACNSCSCRCMYWLQS